MSGVSVKYKIPCTKQDIENIKKLAKYGDDASLALAIWFMEDKELYNLYLKQAADNGSIIGLIRYCESIINKDPALGKSYLEKAKASGTFYGYMPMLRYYSKNQMVSEFCSTIAEGYNKLGFEFMAPKLLAKRPTKFINPKPSPTLFEQYPQLCLKKTPERIFNEVKTDLSLLYSGYQFIIYEEYKKAKKVFQKVYDKSDNEDIKQNAGFCLGAMNYSGIGTKLDKEYGIKLMKEAVDSGYEMLYYIPEIKMIPNDRDILKYRGTCDFILIKNNYK